MRLLVASLLILACATVPHPPPQYAAPPCLQIHGACVLYDASFPVEIRAYLEARIESAWTIGAAYWEADPDSLRGWTVVFHGYWLLSFGAFPIWGRTSPDHLRLDLTLEYPLCPELVLIHELGHAFSYAAGGDGLSHGPDEDPRLDDTAILKALDSLPGCEPVTPNRWLAIEH